MPLYEFECPKCGIFETFAKMSDEPLTECPECGSKVQKLISMPAFSIAASTPDMGEFARDEMSAKLGRKVEKGESYYEVPYQPGGGGGELVDVKGLNDRQKQHAIAEAHIRAGDERITSPDQVEPMQ
jgi:putative FmdB family regulatory protein